MVLISVPEINPLFVPSALVQSSHFFSFSIQLYSKKDLRKLKIYKLIQNGNLYVVEEIRVQWKIETGKIRLYPEQ